MCQIEAYVAKALCQVSLHCSGLFRCALCFLWGVCLLGPTSAHCCLPFLFIVPVECYTGANELFLTRVTGRLTCPSPQYAPIPCLGESVLQGASLPVRSSSVIWNEVILRVNGALLCFFPLPSLSNAFVSWERKDTKAYQWKHHNLLKTLKLFHNTCKNVY